MNLEDFSDIQLMAELLRRYPPDVVPRCIEMDNTGQQSLIAIGRDNAMRIIVHDDDIDELFRADRDDYRQSA